MPLFECSACGSVENTALGEYWTDPEAPLCSECATGMWHGLFAQSHVSDGWEPDLPRFPQFLRKVTNDKKEAD